MGGMDGIDEHNSLVIAQAVQKILIMLDEGVLLCDVELARDDVRRMIVEPTAMQQRVESRPTFIDDLEGLLDPGADLARRSRQGLHAPNLNGQRSRGRHCRQHRNAPALRDRVARTAASATDRVIVEKQHIRHLLAAHPALQKQDRMGRTRHTGRRSPVPYNTTSA